MATSNSGANIHSVLEYAIAQALLSGKVGRASISVPITDLMNAGEGLRMSEAADGVVLKVDIKTSFDTGSEELETEFVEDEEDDQT